MEQEIASECDYYEFAFNSNGVTVSFMPFLFAMREGLFVLSLRFFFFVCGENVFREHDAFLHVCGFAGKAMRRRNYCRYAGASLVSEKWRACTWCALQCGGEASFVQ